MTTSFSRADYIRWQTETEN